MACLILANLEPLGVSGPRRAVLRDFLIGFGLLVGGLGDHLTFMRLARARMDQSHDIGRGGTTLDSTEPVG